MSQHTHPFVLWLFLCTVFLFVGPSCDQNAPGHICLPGTQQQCSCSSIHTGSRTCLLTGSWDTCQCFQRHHEKASLPNPVIPEEPRNPPDEPPKDEPPPACQQDPRWQQPCLFSGKDCTRLGRWECHNDQQQLVCNNTQNQPPFEQCNNQKDDDCDGQIDDGCSWVQALQGPSSIYGCTLDSNGYLYITGVFVEYIKAGSLYFTQKNQDASRSLHGATFQIQMNPKGEFLNVWTFEHFSSDPYRNGHSNGIHLSADFQGSVYLVGIYSYEISFNGTTLTSGGHEDNAYIAKLNTGTTWEWVVPFQSESLVSISDLVWSKKQELWVIGRFGKNLLIDSRRVAGGEELPAYFVARITPQGKLIWIDTNWFDRSRTGQDSISIFRISVDSIGNAYILGSARGSGTLGSFHFQTTRLNDIFIAKIRNDGNWEWCRWLYTPDDEYKRGSWPTAIAVDSSDFIYVTGFHRGNKLMSVMNEKSEQLLPESKDEDVFVLKLDSKGNVLWSKQIGGSQSERSFALAVHSNHTIAISGTLRNYPLGAVVNFGTFPITVHAYEPMFVVYLNQDGQIKKALSGANTPMRSEPSTGVTISKCMTFSPDGALYTAGTFYGQKLMFGNDELSVHGSLANGFIWKLPPLQP